MEITQTLENPTLRQFLKLDKSTDGCVIFAPFENTANYPIKEWDLITHIGDTPIDNQCMVKLTSNVRVMFKYLVQQKAVNGKLPLTIVRNSKTMKVNVPVYRSRPQLIGDLGGGYPSYFIYGPIVFSRATAEFLNFIVGNGPAMMGYAYNASPLVTMRGDAPTEEREELVVVSSSFFPHKLVTGYSNRFGAVLYSVNDIKIRSLAHLVATLRDLKDDLVVLHFEQRYGETIVLPRKTVLSETEAILSDNGIRSQASADMMTIWEKK